MKRTLYSLLFAAAITVGFSNCTDSETPTQEPGLDTPTIVLVGSDIDATHEIADKMTIKVQIAAKAGIKSFSIDIDSPALTAAALSPMNLATHMDLINPASDKMAASLKELGFPAGTSILNSKEQVLDISSFIPMIKLIYGESSNHNFKISIIDNANKSVVKTLKFHLTADKPSTDAPIISLDNGDIDTTLEIVDKMSVKVKIEAKGGIKAFVVDIDSPAFTNETLGQLGLTTHIDLINPGSETVEGVLMELGFPVGKTIIDSQLEIINMSMIIPMITQLHPLDSKHNFKITITDNANLTTVKTLKLHQSSPKPAIPSIKLVNGDIDATHEIMAQMSLKVEIEAVGGIKAFAVDIDSPAFTEAILSSMALSTHMDLINPKSEIMAEALAQLGFPVGNGIINSKKQTVDISALIPQIKQMYPYDSNHNFKVTITDQADQTTIKTLKFHLTV